VFFLEIWLFFGLYVNFFKWLSMVISLIFNIALFHYCQWRNQDFFLGGGSNFFFLTTFFLVPNHKKDFLRSFCLLPNHKNYFEWPFLVPNHKIIRGVTPQQNSANLDKLHGPPEMSWGLKLPQQWRMQKFISVGHHFCFSPRSQSYNLLANFRNSSSKLTEDLFFLVPNHNLTIFLGIFSQLVSKMK